MKVDKWDYWSSVVFFAMFFVLTIAWVSKNNAFVSAIYGALSMGYFLRLLDEAKKFD